MTDETDTGSHDDDLGKFAADGPEPLPNADEEGSVENEGARIWYATYGAGTPVILLHGGLGHGGNWGYQVPALVKGGYRVILMDSRGHGRSTRDTRAFSYERMASDVLALMDRLKLEKADLVGWSDGACTALVLASMAPARVAKVFYFACNMDPSGAKQIMEFTPILGRCISRHKLDYRRLSPTPDRFDELSDALSLMQKTQPDYSAADLAAIRVPVAIVQSEHDEFILTEHARYLASAIPKAEFIYLTGVSHFAPLQRPGKFNRALLAFLG